MQSRIDRELVLSALLVAIWRRKPKQPVLVHSDQGSQFSSEDWQSFLKADGLVGSMNIGWDCLPDRGQSTFQFRMCIVHFLLMLRSAR